MSPKQSESTSSRDPATVRRLTDQLAVYKQVRELKAQVSAAPGKNATKARDTLAKIHDVHRLLDEHAFYPEHDKRKESKEYAAVHKKLTETLDLPCLVCGVRNSTLRDKNHNPYGARQMETHHHIIEWALANAIDVDKFNKSLRPNLAHKHSNDPKYAKPFSAKQIADWVDHDPDNLWVLCDVHHRAQHFGIHEISYPIWAPMDMLRDDFEKYVRTQLMEIAASTKKTK